MKKKTRNWRNAPEMVKLREKRARHLQLIEEVKHEITGTYVKPKQPIEPQQEDRQNPIISYAGPAMTIRLKHDIKPKLKYRKLT